MKGMMDPHRDFPEGPQIPRSYGLMIATEDINGDDGAFHLSGCQVRMTAVNFMYYTWWFANIYIYIT
jgi:hypothetical protein